MNATHAGQWLQERKTIRKEEAQVDPHANDFFASREILRETMRLLGWPTTRRMSIPDGLPEKERLLSYAGKDGHPYLLIRAEDAGRPSDTVKLEQQAKDLGYSWLASSDAETMILTDLKTRSSIKANICGTTPDSKIALSHLSFNHGTGAMLDNLSTYATCLTEAPKVLGMLIDRNRQLIIDYHMELAMRRGRSPDRAQLEQIIASCPSIYQMIATSDGLSDMTTKPCLSSASVATLPGDEPKKTNISIPKIYTKAPGSQHNGEYKIAISGAQVTLLSGSLIAPEISEFDRNSRPRSPLIFRSWEKVVALGDPFPVEHNGQTYLKTRKDVSGLKLASIMNAIYGSSRNSGTTLYCEEDGQLLQDAKAA